MFDVPRAVSARICLQCQIRLSFHALSPRRLPTRQLRLPHFSTSTSAIQDEQARKPDFVTPRDDSVRTPGRTVHRNTRHFFPRSSKPPTKHIYPHGRIRGRTGNEVRESSAQLDIKSLGEESDIIVLRDAGLEREEDVGETQDAEIGSEEPSTHRTPDVLGSIESGRTMGKAEVKEELEKMREDYRQKLETVGDKASKTLLVELRRNIEAQFNKEQLLKYARRLQHTLPADTSTYHCAARQQSGYSIGFWRPLPSVKDSSAFGCSKKALPWAALETMRLTASMPQQDIIYILVNYMWDLEDRSTEGRLKLGMFAPKLELLTAGGKDIQTPHHTGLLIIVQRPRKT
jgi:hypothetical protein